MCPTPISSHFLAGFWGAFFSPQTWSFTSFQPFPLSCLFCVSYPLRRFVSSWGSRHGLFFFPCSAFTPGCFIFFYQRHRSLGMWFGFLSLFSPFFQRRFFFPNCLVYFFSFSDLAVGPLPFSRITAQAACSRLVKLFLRPFFFLYGS